MKVAFIIRGSKSLFFRLFCFEGLTLSLWRCWHPSWHDSSDGPGCLARRGPWITRAPCHLTTGRRTDTWARQGGRGCICLNPRRRRGPNSRWKWPLTILHLENALTSRQPTAITLERAHLPSVIRHTRTSLKERKRNRAEKSHEMYAEHQRTSSPHLFHLIKQLS